MTVFVVFKVELWKGARHWAGVALVESLARAGHAVSVFARPERADNPVFSFLRELGVSVHVPPQRHIRASNYLRYPAKLAAVIRYARRLRSFAEARRELAVDDGRRIDYAWLKRMMSTEARVRRADVVHGFGATQWTGVGLEWARAQAVPAVYTETQQVGNPQYTAQLKQFIAACDGVIIHGRSLEPGFRRIGYRGPVCVIPFATPDRQSTVDSRQSTVVESRRSSGNGLVVGCASRFQREKGLLDLLEAWALVRDRVPGARLVLAGEGDDSAAMTRLIMELKLADVVELRPPYDVETGLADFMRGIDIYCLPSHREGQPVSIIEAMAYGKPVVATDVGSVAELIENGPGIVVPPHAPDALAAALCKLLADPDLRARGGRCARARYMARHRPDALQKSVVQFYRELLALAKKGSDSFFGQEESEKGV